MRIVPAILSSLAAASAVALAGATPAAAAPADFQVISANGPLTVYNPALVPAGSRAHVIALSAMGTTTVLSVHGLLPNHEYGAHAHAKACGATGDAAGPHFQHNPDPVTPSVDPAYANPRNEVWLDFTTDRLGTGIAVSRVDWTFGERRAKSIVIHETHTHTDPGHAGSAGARLACLNVGF
jgi:Cu-Zn family superoxide dismutase